MSDKETTRIGPFPANRAGKVKFINALLQAGKDGFEVPVENFNVETKMQFGSRLGITLRKPSIQEEEAPDLQPLSDEDRAAEISGKIAVSDKIGKDDLIWFAERSGIIIPEDKKLPTAIRKYIKEALENPTEE